MSKSSWADIGAVDRMFVTDTIIFALTGTKAAVFKKSLFHRPSHCINQGTTVELAGPIEAWFGRSYVPIIQGGMVSVHDLLDYDYMFNFTVNLSMRTIYIDRQKIDTKKIRETAMFESTIT